MNHPSRFALAVILMISLASARSFAVPAGTHIHEPKTGPAAGSASPAGSDTVGPATATEASHYVEMKRLPDVPAVVPLSDADGKAALLRSMQSLKTMPGGGDQKQFMDRIQVSHHIFSRKRLTPEMPKESLNPGHIYDGADYMDIFGGNVCANSGLTSVAAGFDGDEYINGCINIHLNSLRRGKLYVLDIAIPISSDDFWVGVGTPASNTDTLMPVTNKHILIPVSMTQAGPVGIQLRGKALWEFQSITIDPVE